MVATRKSLGDPNVGDPLNVSEDRVQLRKHMFSTYRSMRIGMLVIALAFPLVLWIVGGVVYGLSLQDSMSAYYWASIKEGGGPPMRVWFVGILFALATCLFLYKGYTRLEDSALNVAAVCAFLVALVPMCWTTESECPSWRKLHGGSAIVFFVLLASVSILHALYALGWLQGGSRRPRSKYWLWYVGTALVMVLSPIGAGIFFETNPARTFWTEVAGIVAFCIFWGVQSWQIHNSGFDQELAQRE